MSHLKSAHAPRGQYRGVMGQPYIDLEPFIDTTGLDEMTDEITEYLVRNRGKFHIIGYNDVQELENHYYHLGFDPNSFPCRRRIADFNQTENMLLNSFFEPVLPFQQIVRLNQLMPPYDAQTIEYADGCELTEHAAALPKTMGFLNRLPLKEMGWTTLYHTMPDQEVPTHRDYHRDLGFDPQFIYINPLKKPFFVMNDEGKKTLVDTRLAYFNLNDMHGLARSYKSGFSIRVNGLWSDDFLDATGMREYFERGKENRKRPY